MAERIRIAAAGDLHADEAHHERLVAAFERVDGDADVVLLAGDLTTHGRPEQASVLAEACRRVAPPVFAVLGNHDHHEALADDVAGVLRDAGVTVLDRQAAVCTLDEVEIGIVGTKGFVGGFPGSSLPDFGEPLLRRVYAETTDEV